MSLWKRQMNWVKMNSCSFFWVIYKLAIVALIPLAGRCVGQSLDWSAAFRLAVPHLHASHFPLESRCFVIQFNGLWMNSHCGTFSLSDIFTFYNFLFFSGWLSKNRAALNNLSIRIFQVRFSKHFSMYSLIFRAVRTLTFKLEIFQRKSSYPSLVQLTNGQALPFMFFSFSNF